MFLDTLGISTTAVRTAFEKYDKQTGTQEPDKRGRHDNKKRIDKIQEQRVIEHISSFKVVESHYVRKNEKCQFLPKDLTISEMHRLFLRFCEEKSYEKVNFDFYKRVFRRKFRLKFQKPKKDECNTCASYKGLEEAQRQHRRDKEYTRSLKDELKSLAKKEEHVVTAAFDLQQVLLCPFGATGIFYYSRRLKNHNLTVTEIDNMTTHAYLWNEHEGRKGSCEVATCVMDFLEKMKNQGKKVVYLFSDKCGGQNLNRMFLIMLSNSVVKLNLEKIELIYLCPGHSQNENDNAHSVTENASKSKFIYNKTQWETTITQALKKNTREVKVLMHDDFIDFKSIHKFPEYSEVLQDKCQVVGSGKKRKVMWASIKQVKFI